MFEVMRLWLLPLLVAGASCTAIAGLDGQYTVGEAGGPGGGAATSSGSGGAGSGASGGSEGGRGGMAAVGGGSSTGAAGAAGGSGGSGGGGGSVCGNKVMESGEECDDGNTDALDGCSSSCTIEDPDSCSAAPLIVLSAQQKLDVSGDTTGAADDITTSTSTAECGTGTRIGSDHVYAVLPQASGTLDVSLNASYDYHFLHMRAACPGTVDLGCDYDTSSSTIDDFSVPVVMGITYYIIVDSWDPSEAGAYTLSVTLN
jgi:cysteine-rich repeat protein